MIQFFNRLPCTSLDVWHTGAQATFQVILGLENLCSPLILNICQCMVLFSPPPSLSHTRILPPLVTDKNLPYCCLLTFSHPLAHSRSSVHQYFTHTQMCTLILRTLVSVSPVLPPPFLTPLSLSSSGTPLQIVGSGTSWICHCKAGPVGHGCWQWQKCKEWVFVLCSFTHTPPARTHSSWCPHNLQKRQAY